MFSLVEPCTESCTDPCTEPCTDPCVESTPINSDVSVEVSPVEVSPVEIVNELYKISLGRYPEKAEMKAATDILGTLPNQENIQDLIWAIVLLPEFQLIY